MSLTDIILGLATLITLWRFGDEVQRPRLAEAELSAGSVLDPGARP
jgi:hypothetical protein